VRVVDEFSAAIRAAKLDQAAKLLDDKVLILESGGSERSRDQYLAEHAVADAAFMQGATQQLRFRRARAEGAMAWVGTESIVTHSRDGKPETVLSTESMVLHKSAEGWKIVHIHWSSRRPRDG
jgi:ketosteroid isomerase-like protein